MLPPTHPVLYDRNPIAFSTLRSALVVCSYGQDVDVKGDVDPNDVVHVVQESVVRAAQKTHATRQLRSIAVCCGQWKTPIVLRQFAKVQVEELGATSLACYLPR